MDQQEPIKAASQPGQKRRNALFQRRQKAIAATAALVAEQLNEPNTAAIARFMEIFGEEFVSGMARDARERFDAAQAMGPEAYRPQPNGSSVATYTGMPRSPGGILFYLMREHATTLGLDWFGLRIPSAPRDPAPTTRSPAQTAQSAPQAVTVTDTQAPAPRQISPPTKGSSTATENKERDQSRSADNTTTAKPNRIKATVIGIPMGDAKPTDQLGVLQFVFDVEMSSSMPKGLPTLGRSRVVVLCNERQYRQVSSAGGISGRMLVEGEVAPTLSIAGKPLLVLVCTRLTTLEIEQAKRSSESSG